MTIGKDIESAVDYIATSKGFIGFDGFLAYVAMSLKIPTCIFWHDQRLPAHYMNKQWESHTTQYFSGNIINEIPAKIGF